MAAKVTDRKILGTVDLVLEGKTYPGIEVAELTTENTYKGQTTVKQYLTTGPISDEYGANLIRIYHKSGLLKGLDLDFDTQIKPLFEGEVVHFDSLNKKDNSTYEADLVFYPLAIPSFVEKNRKPPYLGNLTFYNG